MYGFSLLFDRIFWLYKKNKNERNQKFQNWKLSIQTKLFYVTFTYTKKIVSRQNDQKEWKLKIEKLEKNRMKNSQICTLMFRNKIIPDIKLSSNHVSNSSINISIERDWTINSTSNISIFVNKSIDLIGLVGDVMPNTILISMLFHQHQIKRKTERKNYKSKKHWHK